MTEHLSTAGTFAAAIARRYGEAPLMAPPLDMIVRLNPRLSAERRSFFETRVQMAPLIRVTVTHPPSSVSRLPPARSHHVPALPTIVRRLVQRQRRLDPGSPTRPADLQPSLASSFGPVESPPAPAGVVAQQGVLSPVTRPMIVRRGVTAPPAGPGGNESRNSTSSSRAFEREGGPRTHGDERRTGQAPTAIDVERLTDQVVRAIDRRIVAYRERTTRS